jgi:hemolysin activation/secretion protein
LVIRVPIADTGRGGKPVKRTDRARLRGGAAAALAIAAVLAAGVSSAALAQVAAPPEIRDFGGAAPAIVSPVPRVTPPPQPEIVPPAAPAPPPAVAVPEGPPVRVDQVRVEGVTVYDPATLEPLYADLVGATVPRSRLAEVVEALQTRYRADGYILTVVRGRNEVVNGRNVFVLQAIEGYIGSVKLDGDIGPAGTLVYGFLDNLTTIRPVQNADLERYLLLAQDVPGVTVRAVLHRSENQPGAVELIAQLSRKPFSAFYQYDNRGSPEVGPNEMLAAGAANSFTSFGEQLQALFFNTFNREQIFGQVNASAFLGTSGLKFLGYFGRGNSKPGGALTGTGFDSNLQVSDLGLSYPLIRSRRLNLSLNGLFYTYDSPIDLTGPTGAPTLSSESHLRILRAGGALDFQDAVAFDLPAATQGVLFVSQGLTALGASSNNAALPARPNNRIDFTKMTGELTRVQNLATFGDVGTALKLSIGGQYTGDILPPSEKFYLGGNRFGRGYWYGQITGDRAIGSTVELQINKGFTDVPLLGPERRLDVQLYGFWDTGFTYNLAAGDLNQNIKSLGLGVRSDLTEWLFVELEGVHRLVLQPNGANTNTLAGYAGYARVVVRY